PWLTRQESRRAPKSAALVCAVDCAKTEPEVRRNERTKGTRWVIGRGRIGEEKGSGPCRGSCARERTSGRPARRPRCGTIRAALRWSAEYPPRPGRLRKALGRPRLYRTTSVTGTLRTGSRVPTVAPEPG